MDHLKDICKLAEGIAKEAATTKHKPLSEASNSLKDKLSSLSSVSSATAALPIVKEGIELTKNAIVKGGHKVLCGRFLKSKKTKGKNVAAQLGIELGDLAKALSVLQLVIFSHLSSSAVDAEGEHKRAVLWVDDNPENNKKEAKGFSDSYHVKVTQEVSTKNAKKFLENNKHLITQPPSHFRIITDNYREGEGPNAGAKLIAFLRKQGYTTPICIYCSNALDGLSTQASHPSVTTATTAALLNVFVQSMLAKPMKVEEESDEESEGEEAKGKAKVKGKGKGKAKGKTKKDEEEEEEEEEEKEKGEKEEKEEKESEEEEVSEKKSKKKGKIEKETVEESVPEKVEEKEEEDGEEEKTTTTTTTTTSSPPETPEEVAEKSQIKKSKSELKEESEDDVSMEEAPKSPALEPTQTEEDYQEDEKSKKEKMEEEERIAKEKKDKEEQERKEEERKQLEKEEEERQEAKRKEEEAKRIEEEKKEAERKEEEERKEAERKAEKKKAKEAKRLEEERREEEERKEAERKEKEKKEAEKKEKERKEAEKKEKEKQEAERKEKEKEKKEAERKEKEKKEKQEQERKEAAKKEAEKEAKRKEEEKRIEKEKKEEEKRKEQEAAKLKQSKSNLSKGGSFNSSFNSSFSKEPPSKLWSIDKLASSIVPGSLTTFYLRHSSPKSVPSSSLSQENLNFEVVVFPSNSKYLLEGFVFPVKAGVFGIRFFPVTRGEYKVSVKLGDDHLVNSPFVLSSEPQQSLVDDDEDILDMLDGKSSNAGDTPNTSVDTSADSSMDNKFNYKNKTPLNNNKTMKKSLSPFSFMDHVEKEGDTDESFGSKKEDDEEEEEEMTDINKSNVSEFEPTLALESESDTSFETNANYKKGGNKHLDLVPTQALEEGGDTEEDTDGSDSEKKNTTKRKRKETGLSDVETEPDTDNSDNEKGKKDMKKKKKKVNGNNDDSLATVPY